VDFNALQHQLFNLDPVDPREDLEKIKNSLNEGQIDYPAQTDYVNNSFEVPEGSLPLDKDYSVDDFAALAGVVNEGKQKDGDYAKGSGPMPKAKLGRTKHPLHGKLVGETEENSVDEKLDMINSKLDKLLNLLDEGSVPVKQDSIAETSNSQKNDIDNIKEDLYDRLNNMLDKK